MSAKRDLYLAIKRELEEKTSVKHVRLYNDQFENMDKENTFAFPCVFVQFANLDWSTETEGIQKGATIIRLHVGFESLATEELDKFDVIDDEIHKYIEGLEGVDFTKLSRISEEQDINHDNVYVWLMDYSTEILDCSGSRRGKMTKTIVTGLNVNVNTDTEHSKPRLLHK